MWSLKKENKNNNKNKKFTHAILNLFFSRNLQIIILKKVL